MQTLDAVRAPCEPPPYAVATLSRTAFRIGRDMLYDCAQLVKVKERTWSGLMREMEVPQTRQHSAPALITATASARVLWVARMS